MLRDLYLETLAACEPGMLIARCIADDLPRNVLAIGKCAGALAGGLPRVDDALVVVPEGYPRGPFRTLMGGHPQITHASFDAGREAVRFVDEHEDVLFVVSGGGSACVELPLPPFTEDDLIETNAKLIAAGIPIRDINCVRKHLSAIKGGRLRARVRGRSVTLIYSDVSTGALADVASGPTLPDPTTNADAAQILERIGGCDRIVNLLRTLPDERQERLPSDARLIADNGTLTAAAGRIAASRGFAVVQWEGQIEMDVAEAAQQLAARARTLRRGEILVSGGEPTVLARGGGRGGRCSELAVRFALLCGEEPGIEALFASSDGVDGNSGAAGIELRLPARIDPDEGARSLEASDSFPLASRIGDAIMIPPTGNNLRDLFLLART